jgi:glycosyltransferase involved in cell wall biosynthesis
VRVLLVAQQLRRAAPGGIGTYLRGLADALPAEVEATRWAGPTSIPAPLVTRAWDRGLLRAPTGYDLVHAPSLATPSPRRGTPLVVALHDVLWRELPDAYPRRGRRWHEAALQRAVHRGAHFVVPTAATADKVAADAGAERVHLVEPMYGCDHLAPADSAGAAALLERIGVSGPYLLTVATVEPRKNLPRLVEAFVRARPLLPEPWPLVVVGPPGWGTSLRPQPGVVVAGAVSDAVLAALYAGARCVAYVPLLEGWGLPAVEAMAACTPVVASPMPSTGGAALEVDPRDTASIAEGLVVAAGDERRRAELVTAGLLRTADLTWEAAGRAHCELWTSLA